MTENLAIGLSPQRKYKKYQAINGYRKLKDIEIWDLNPMFWRRK